MGVIDLMLACSLAGSRGEARRLIEQGGVSIDGEKVADISAVIPVSALAAGVKIKKGKKVFHRAVICK
jgi:tyrosyl-tRNA synthetase